MYVNIKQYHVNIKQYHVIRLPATNYDSDDDVSAGSCDYQWETKSRFTEYSITSSVVPRSKGISCLCDVCTYLHTPYSY